MTPAAYDAWYRTPRGAWIGETEFRLLRTLLQPELSASVIDVGCGTGYFTRRLARTGLLATGIDSDTTAIHYAETQTAAGEQYLVGDARALPFPDAHFDYGVAITSLCFIPDQARALAELARVTRKGIALGLLNRHSLLQREKGRHGGQGAYRGAHWHTAHEVRRLFAQCGISRPTIRSAIYLPRGGTFARIAEAVMPHRILRGGFLLAVAEI